MSIQWLCGVVRELIFSVVIAVSLISNIHNHAGLAYADWSDWKILNFPGIRPCEYHLLCLKYFARRQKHQYTLFTTSFCTNIEHSFNYKYGGCTAHKTDSLFATES